MRLRAVSSFSQFAFGARRRLWHPRLIDFLSLLGSEENKVNARGLSRPRTQKGRKKASMLLTAQYWPRRKHRSKSQTRNPYARKPQMTVCWSSTVRERILHKTLTLPLFCLLGHIVILWNRNSIRNHKKESAFLSDLGWSHCATTDPDNSNEGVCGIRLQASSDQILPLIHLYTWRKLQAESSSLSEIS